MGKVSIGQLWKTELYGEVEVIEALPKTHFIGKFINTGFVTKPSQAKAFYTGKITDFSVKNKVEDSYGYWSVLGEVESSSQPSGQKKRVILCKCVCGKSSKVTLDSLTRGTSTNCGCVSFKESTHFHGDSYSRLYYCWRNMKARCTKRGDSCKYQKSWENFSVFKEWATSNGYSDDLILIRGTKENPDVGNYEEGNCRWGTKTDNYYDWKLSEELKENENERP